MDVVTNTNTETTAVATVATTPATETTSSGSKFDWDKYYKSFYSQSVNYDKKGKRNITSFPEFIEVCKFSQEELKIYLIEELIKAGYTDVVSDDGYVYAKGTTPILLTAHMDTIHKELVQDIYEYYDKENGQHIISSPQGIGGDDRCGIYMILQIIKDYKPSILFCEDEETGGIGSNKFCKTEFIMELSELNYLIELDRKNSNDAVFYNCDNPDFTEFITENTGYEKAFGSFSDISHLSPECMIASVNLSCGYYNAHTTSEYVIVEEMLNTIETVKELLSLENSLEEPVQYEYIEKTYSYGGVYGGSSRFGNIYDDDDDDYSWYNKYNRSNYGNTYGKSNYGSAYQGKIFMVQIIWYDMENRECSEVVHGDSIKEAIGDFLMNHSDMSFNDIYDYYIA